MRRSDSWGASKALRMAFLVPFLPMSWMVATKHRTMISMNKGKTRHDYNR
jgi:hypothetical protein